MREVLVWKDTGKRSVSRKSVIGFLANWAVRQSPYLQPVNIDKGIEEFDSNFICDEIESMDLEDLGNKIISAIKSSPQIVAWNTPKIGDPQFMTVSRYHHPKPDYDFIDLGALARNIRYSVWLELMYDDGCFEGSKVPT